MDMKVEVDKATGTGQAGASDRLTLGGIVARMERLPGNAMQIRARVLIGCATFFDGFDVIAIAATLPMLIAKWGLAPSQIAFLIAAGSVGQLIGALLFPALAERYGRVRTIAWSSGIIGITSIACGFAPSYASFVVLRAVQGVGLGGELPVAAAYISEITRAHGRGRFVLLYEIIFPIGLLVSNALGAWLVPVLGWQVIYFVGGVPLILAFTLRRLVPESPRWLGQRGRMTEAAASLAAFEASVKGPLPPLPSGEAAQAETLAKHPKRGLRDLFGPLYLKRTISVAMLWMTCGVIQYGLLTWLPTIYKTVYHAPLQLALNLTVGASVLGVIGSLICALVVDKVGRKPVINVSFLLCAIALFGAAVFHDSSVYVVGTFCALSFGLLGCGFITAYVYTPELYPTSVRALGCGVGSAWLKIAAIAAPALVSKTITTNISVAFYAFGAVLLVAALVIHRLGIETKGQVLEQLES
ncbi:MFS transporter [Burkholderia plantarii]|nr:major facilitator superfamily protein [Burkholderia plantarii]GLZ18944.1 MFS transporter [Burkholderia plantarii]